MRNEVAMARLRWRPVGWVLFAFALAACGGDDDDDDDANVGGGKNVCEQACDKVETCPGQQCTLQINACDGDTKAAAECVLQTSCDQLLSCAR